MSIPESVRCYLVRTDPGLVEQSIIGIGWSEFDFSAMQNAEEAIRAVQQSPYGIRRHANQIRRFFGIQEGDLIVASLPYAVAIGRASGGLFYDAGSNLANRRRVEFPKNAEGKVKKLPRDAFPEAFARRLRVRGMTVNDLGEFQEELMRAYTDVMAGKDYSWALVIAEKVEAARESFKKDLLERIRNGKTNLRTGGAGLEYLVRELLEIEGYTARVLSTRAFPSFADADVEAMREDPCAMVKLLVQVKHHQWHSGEHGLAQLEEIRNRGLKQYDEHRLVFCTSAETSDAFDSRAEDSEISVIDGSDLVDWIVQRMDRLSAETKTRLGVCELPAFI